MFVFAHVLRMTRSDLFRTIRLSLTWKFLHSYIMWKFALNQCVFSSAWTKFSSFLGSWKQSQTTDLPNDENQGQHQAGPAGTARAPEHPSRRERSEPAVQNRPHVLIKSHLQTNLKSELLGHEVNVVTTACICVYHLWPLKSVWTWTWTCDKTVQMAKATEMAHQPKSGEAEKDMANLERSLCLYFQFLHEAADLIDQLVVEARQHVKYIDSKIDHLRICNR